MIDSVTFWQQMPTPHMLPLARELAGHVPCVRFAVFEELIEERRAIAWSDKPAKGVEHIHIRTSQDIDTALAGRCGARDFHFLPGMNPLRVMRKLQRQLRQSDGQIVLASEAPWFKGRSQPEWLWTLRDTILARLWAKRANRFFAVGDYGVAYFAACNFPASKLHNFGYFPDIAQVSDAPIRNGPVSIVVAAALIKRKGLDILIDALGMLNDLEWSLRIAGDGTERDTLRRRASALGIDHRIEWLGWQTGDCVTRLMASASVAVLPSRFDGWGAVVNEALGQGTPVIVSSAAAASCLIVNKRLGEIVPVGSVTALSQALRDRILNPPSAADHRWIADWAQRHIAPSVAAAWLANALQDTAVGEVPPWQAIAVPKTGG